MCTRSSSSFNGTAVWYFMVWECHGFHSFSSWWAPGLFLTVLLLQTCGTHPCKCLQVPMHEFLWKWNCWIVGYRHLPPHQVLRNDSREYCLLVLDTPFSTEFLLLHISAQTSQHSDFCFLSPCECQVASPYCFNLHFFIRDTEHLPFVHCLFQRSRLWATHWWTWPSFLLECFPLSLLMCRIFLYVLSTNWWLAVRVSRSVMSDSATPWTVGCQASLSMGFSRQEHWSGLPFPLPGHLPDPGIEPRSPALQADSLPSEPLGKPWLLWLYGGRYLLLDYSLSLTMFRLSTVSLFWGIKYI